MCENSVLKQIGYIHIPIYMNLNRYGNNAINGWDGNSIDLGSTNGGTILAPQVGAGRKEPESNTFTGVLIGQQKNKNSSEVGLFGYNFGERSIFLDAQSGKAEFGKQGNGKVTIDPNLKVRRKSNVNWNDAKQAGLLYSGNYTLPSVEDIPNSSKKGITLDVDTYTSKTGGMIIDLSTPQIGFGSGNFRVNPEGHITAKGGGSIAGWGITDNRLFKNNTGMASENFPASSIGAELPNESASIAFYAGTSDHKNNFYVTHSGYFFSREGNIAGWNITPTDLWHKTGNDNRVGMNSDPSNRTYMLNNWPDGKTHKAKAFFANGNNFYVTHDGYLRSTSGKIATWDINSTYLSNGNVGLGSTTINKNRFGTDGNLEARIWSKNNVPGDGGVDFAVDNQGNLYARAGKIGGWNIGDSLLWAGSPNNNQSGLRLHSNGSIDGGSGYTSGSSVNGHWSISENGFASFDGIMATNATVTGKITADELIAQTAGTIGGWIIDSTSLTSKNIKLDSNGSLKHTGNDWEISSDGDAYFKNIYGTVKDGQSLSSGGSGGSGGGSGWTMPGGGGAPTWNYDSKQMTPRTIKSYNKLNLHLMQLISGKNIKVMTGTVSQRDVAGWDGQTTHSVSVTINLSGVSCDGKPLSGKATGSVTIPKLTHTTARDFTGVADMKTSKICDGWGTVNIDEWQVMASKIDDAVKPGTQE